MYKTTWAEIDLGALARNIRKARKALGGSSSLCGVVKADAYGHGAVEAARVFQKEGACFLAVANLREALDLRIAGIEGSIFTVGWTPPEGFEAAVEAGISLTVFSEDELNGLAEVAKRAGKKAKVHLKMETGMNRLGALWDGEIAELARKAAGFSEIEIEGVFSHFANAGIKDRESVEMQLSRYLKGIEQIKALGIKPGIRHIANSAALFYYPESHLDMVRFGAGVYGMGIDEAVGLELVMTLKSRISHLKEIATGERVSYRWIYESSKKTKIATLPIGYADGWTWALGGYEISRAGHKLPIVGEICMDQMMIDVSEWQGCQIGDEIILMGKGGPTPAELAKYAGITVLELPTRLAKRVPRVYVDE